MPSSCHGSSVVGRLAVLNLSSASNSGQVADSPQSSVFLARISLPTSSGAAPKAREHTRFLTVFSAFTTPPCSETTAAGRLEQARLSAALAAASELEKSPSGSE